MTTTTITITPQDAPTPDEAKALAAMLKRVNTDKPKPADVDALRRVLDGNARIWRTVGDAAAPAVETTIDAAYSSALHRESVRRKLEELKGELGAGGATPVERMLIDHVALCWLRLHIAEMIYTNRLHKADSHPYAAGVYWEKRLTGAQRRFTRALETLAKVRMMTAATGLIEQRAAAARPANTLDSTRLLKGM